MSPTAVDGHVLKLIRFRYGAAGVPDDEAGRPDLMELIWLASSAPAPWADKKVRNCIELYAPWMDERREAGLAGTGCHDPNL